MATPAGDFIVATSADLIAHSQVGWTYGWIGRWIIQSPRFHQVHHSSVCLDWLAASRLHLADIVVTRAVGFVPVYVLGFSTGPTYAYLVFVSFLAIFIHANVRFRFGPLRHVVATPQFSFQDYLETRVFHLLLTIFHYEGNFDEAFAFARSLGLKPFDLVVHMQAQLAAAPAGLEVSLHGFEGQDLITTLSMTADETGRFQFDEVPYTQARQFVVHRHILVNGKRVDRPSFRVKPGQMVHVHERSEKFEPFQIAAAGAHQEVLDDQPDAEEPFPQQVPQTPAGVDSRVGGRQGVGAVRRSRLPALRPGPGRRQEDHGDPADLVPTDPGSRSAGATSSPSLSARCWSRCRSRSTRPVRASSRLTSTASSRRMRTRSEECASVSDPATSPMMRIASRRSSSPTSRRRQDSASRSARASAPTRTMARSGRRSGEAGSASVSTRFGLAIRQIYHARVTQQAQPSLKSG